MDTIKLKQKIAKKNYRRKRVNYLMDRYWFWKNVYYSTGSEMARKEFEKFEKRANWYLKQS